MSEYFFEIYPLLVSCVSPHAIFLNASESVSLIPPKNTNNPKLKTEIKTDRLDAIKSLDKTKVKSNISLFNIINIRELNEVNKPITPKMPNPGITNTSSAINIIPMKNNIISQFSATPFK